MYKNLVVVIILIGVGILFVLLFNGGSLKDDVKGEPVEISGETTTFAEIGNLTFDNPGSPGLTLVYEEPGAPALTKMLILDEKSVCAASNGATQCMALSVDLQTLYEGRRAVVEGIDADESSVVVRKLSLLSEGEPEFGVEPGSTFITWAEAIELIENCQAEMVMQTHALDVYITLVDGERVRAVEPVIDEVFSVLEGVRDRCGTIPVATE